MRLTEDEVRVAVSCGPHPAVPITLPGLAEDSRVAHLLADRPDEGVRLVDRIIYTPSTGVARVARSTSREGRKYRLRCPRCGLDVALRQQSLDLVAARLADGDVRSVTLSQLAKIAATLI